MDSRPLTDNPRIDVLWRQGRFQEAMQEPIHAPSNSDERLKALLSSSGTNEDAAFGAMTLGEVIYDCIHIDPMVLEAAEFSHVRSIHDIFSFSLWSARFTEFQDPHGRGALNGLQGFTAERIFAIHLENQGHDVQLERVPNYPGADALVDGHPFQFKCLDSIQGIRDHFSTYNYPVIVNSDLADQVVGMHGVYVDDLVQRAQIRDIAESSMRHGTGLATGHVPWISLVASFPVPLYRLYRRETDVAGVVTAIVTNSSARLIGGSLGGKSVALLGALLFGPAGAVIGLSLGSIVGARTGRRFAGFARNALTMSQADAVRSAAVDVATVALDSIPLKREAWERKRLVIINLVAQNSVAAGVRDYVIGRHDDESAYLVNQAQILGRVRTEAKEGDPVGTWHRVLSLTKRAGIHAHVIQEPLQRLEALVSEFRNAKKRWMAT